MSLGGQLKMTAPLPQWVKDDNEKVLQKKRAQVKSRFYYIFWGAATLSVLAGQLYVGTGYRAYAGALLRIFDTIEVEVQRDYSKERFY